MVVTNYSMGPSFLSIDPEPSVPDHQLLTGTPQGISHGCWQEILL